VIGAVYDPDPVRRQARGIVTAATQNAVHDAATQQAARAEQAQLQAERARLAGELSFVPDPVYRLDGQGMTPDEYLGKVGRELRLRILRTASEKDVDLQDKDLVWPTPTSVDEIRAVLFGLELIDLASKRLFDAHDAVRAMDARAPGLAAMTLRIEDRRRAERGPPRPRGGAEVEIKDLVEQQSVAFEFKSDLPTALAFLESLRQQGKTLTVDAGLSLVRPGRRGDPLTVKGMLSALVLKQL
jgi:hypothetical protein